MRKFVTLALAAALGMGAAGVSTAHHNAFPDQSTHGLCTAYFAGSEQGQEKKRQNGHAFQTLEAAAEEWAEQNTPEGEEPPTGEDAVRAYCAEFGGRPGNGNGGGNGNGSGRP